jgi:hypothetical protein
MAARSSVAADAKPSTKKTPARTPCPSKDFTMRLMLSTTHEALLKSLRDVHAAQLQVERLKLQQAQEQLESGKAVNAALELRLKLLSDLVTSQQRTINTAMSDLVILKGAGRVRTEAEKPHEPQELRPDVEITDAPTDMADRRGLIKQAADEYERALAALAKEVDVSKVTPAALAAAVPASPEDWEREHAQPSDSDRVVLVPAGL